MMKETNTKLMAKCIKATEKRRKRCRRRKKQKIPTHYDFKAKNNYSNAKCKHKYNMTCCMVVVN
jgi:hypothetical protein